MKILLQKRYNDLLVESKNAPSGSIQDERIDAQLCLLEQLLEELEQEGENELLNITLIQQ